MTAFGGWNVELGSETWSGAPVTKNKFEFLHVVCGRAVSKDDSCALHEGSCFQCWAHRSEQRVGVGSIHKQRTVTAVDCDLVPVQFADTVFCEHVSQSRFQLEERRKIGRAVSKIDKYGVLWRGFVFLLSEKLAEEAHVSLPGVARRLPNGMTFTRERRGTS